MSLEFFTGAVALVALAGCLWYWKNRQLAASLFGTDYRLRYVQRRWVIEGKLEGINVRYATGGGGFFPALSYLLMPIEISRPFSLGEGIEEGEPPEAGCDILNEIRARDGFQRLDGLTMDSAPVASSGRVTWLHPGAGLLLRRYTRLGSDPEFVRQDIQLLIALMRQMRDSSPDTGPLL